MQSTLVVLALASSLRLILADLPVHCLRHQVVGDWEFTLGQLGPKRTSCGHRKPDNPLQQPHLQLLESQGPLAKRKLTLEDPNTASSEEGSSGTWTMIYDEGFEVAMDDFVYFAFSKFTFIDGAPEGQNNISHCGETQIGWYHDKQRTRWGCYVGKKVNADAEGAVGPTLPPAATLSSPVAESAPLDAFGSGADEPVPQVENQKKRKAALLSSEQEVMAPDEDIFTEPPEYKPWVPSSPGYDKPMPGNWQQSVAEALNFLQLGWTASVYDKFTGKTPRELNRYAGVRHNRPHAQQKAQQNDADTLKHSFTSFLGVESRVRRASIEGDAFDWRNKDGKNWLEPVVTQGDCGSCYTISTVHMLTARNRISSGSVSEPSFSISFPLYCSEYNQGCDGGYGFLQSKWNEDVGLVPENCLPFSQGGGSCSVVSSCNLGGKRYRASGHHYVGGYYGGSDADSIRQELMEKGPVVMSFEPKEDFMYYKNGVYQSGPNKIHQEWEQVDHAVLLVGYGVDGKQEYWTLQNSWGNDWGEDGYFRMARGTDESGCESIVVSADVVQENSNSVLDDFIAHL
jgi:cathepsin C